MRLIPGLLATAFLASCSTLPVPGPVSGTTSSGQAVATLRESARRQGNPWKNYRRVEVAYSGEWNAITVKLQPVLTDPAFRKASVETYQPQISRVKQIHTGPGGTKEVLRSGRKIEVAFNGKRSSDGEVKSAAALVADAYTIFLFGPSWLAQHGRDLRLLDERKLDGETCRLIAGRLSPGLGDADEDYFIVWIGAESGLMKRFQFSLNGLASTRGADVDVVFSEYWTAADGSMWPGRFIERIQRPVPVQAHDWKMTGLTLDGRKMSKLPTGLF